MILWVNLPIAIFYINYQLVYVIIIEICIFIKLICIGMIIYIIKLITLITSGALVNDKKQISYGLLKVLKN